MTREDAKRILNRVLEEWVMDDNVSIPREEALRVAIKALEQEPLCDKCVYSTKDGYCQYDDITETIPPLEPSGDLISREAVLDLAKKGVLVSNRNYESVCKAITELPPVKPQEPKTGHWIEENHDEYEIWICSECGAYTELDMSEEYGCGWKFCPMCGAKMFEPQESEDKDADSN